MISARGVKVRLFIVLLAPLVCGTIRGDGKVFARAVAVPVTTPDQRALLHFSNGLERLVIETSFIGEGTNFAWVVPLPSAPKIEAVSTNFFLHLNTAFQPELIYRPSRAWIWFVGAGLVIGVAIWSYQTRGGKSLAAWLLFVFVLLLAAGIALPALSTAKAGSSTYVEETVRVLRRETAGVYQTAILSSTNGGALLEWLNRHGFHTPTNTLPVISSYAKEGWVFAAAMLKREGTNEARPHPLAFTFETKDAVYPLRLTGIDNNECTIELVVFGERRAEAPGFKVEHCGPPLGYSSNRSEKLYSRRELFVPPWPGQYRLGNREVRSFALPAATVTKLQGKLGPRQMKADAWIRWVPFEAALPTYYSREAARARAWNRFLGISVVGALLVQLVWRRLSGRMRVQLLLTAAAIGAADGLVNLVLTPTTEVKILSRQHQGLMRFYAMKTAIEDYVEARKRTTPLTFEELTNALAEYGAEAAENTFKPQPLRNEATPGNITLESGTNGVRIFWHDIYGGAHLLNGRETKR